MSLLLTAPFFPLVVCFLIADRTSTATPPWGHGRWHVNYFTPSCLGFEYGEDPVIHAFIRELLRQCAMRFRSSTLLPFFPRLRKLTLYG
jgi:hypothetical protein